MSCDVHFTNLQLVHNFAAGEVFVNYRPKHRFIDWKILQEVCEYNSIAVCKLVKSFVSAIDSSPKHLSQIL